jgi:hypothetical protein
MPEGAPNVGTYPNSYSYPPGRDYCLLYDNSHSDDRPNLEWPVEMLKPERELQGQGDVGGCGLLVDPNDKLAIFFTFNGKIIGDFRGMELGLFARSISGNISVCAGFLYIEFFPKFKKMFCVLIKMVVCLRIYRLKNQKSD